MDRTQNDLDMWSFMNMEKFIQIMVEVARKEEATNSKKTKQFNELQWNEILRELGMRTGRRGYTIKKIREKFTRIKKEYRLFKDLKDSTGMGWDEATQTVTAMDKNWRTYLLANPDATKFREKGLNHFEELDELLSNSLANGAFGHPCTMSPPTLDEEVAMYEVGKPIKKEDNVSMGSKGKRKSDGSGGSSMKATRFGKKEEAYKKFAFSHQTKGEYYKMKILNQSDQGSGPMKNCHAYLKLIKPIVGQNKYLAAYRYLVDNPPWTTSFLALEEDERIAWVNRF